MSCSSCNCNVCSCSVDACGCPQDVNSKCVFYKGTTTSCLGITTGTNLQDIIQAFDAAICDLPTPSGGNTYVVNGTTNQIVVTSSTAGSETTYTVALSPTITTHLTTIDSSIVTLGNCTATSIQELTTSSSEITVTPNGALGCGTTWSIDYTPPSGTPIYDGIVHNDNYVSYADGLGGTQTLKTFTKDYNTDNLLAPGDEIRFETMGQCEPTVSGVDSVIIEFYNTNTASVILSESILLSSYSNQQGWEFSGTIAKQTATTGNYIIKFEATGTIASTLSNVNINLGKYTLIRATDFANLQINVKCVNNSLSTSGTLVSRFMVEVRKQI